MKAIEPPFVGFWHVVGQETCIAGEWVYRFDFEPNEWIIDFSPDGHYGEARRDPGGRQYGAEWSYDPKTGIITLRSTLAIVPEKRIFRATGERGLLYLFEDLPHIRPNCNIIIWHHAYERLRLVRP